MSVEPSVRISGYMGAWAIVFLSTILSGILACASLFTVSSFQVPGQTLPGFAGVAQLVTMSILFGGIVAMPVGLISATGCAFLLRYSPAGRIVLPMMLTSVAVGVVTAPVFFVFSAVCVLIAQFMAAVLIAGPDMDRDATDLSRCAGCGYSLAGLDRAKSSVCPECGGAIPSTV